MKCPCCKYEKRDEQYTVDKVIRYKSGKRKGEIKAVEQDTIEPDKDKADFARIEFRKDVDELGVKEYGFCRDDFTEIRLWMCPECGVLFSDTTWAA